MSQETGTPTVATTATAARPGLLRRIPRSHLAAGVVLLLLLLYPVVNPWNPYTQGVMLLGFSLAVQASGWNIISGYAGYTSLGHSMFVGLGSYTVADRRAAHRRQPAAGWRRSAA